MKLRTTIAVVAASAALAACGGKDSDVKAAGSTADSGASTSASDAPGSSKQSSTTKAAANPVAAALKLPDACTFVRSSDIAAAYGSTVSEGKLSDDSDNQCEFELSGTSKAGAIGLFSDVGVRIDTRDAHSAYDRVKVVFPNAVKQSIGDEAYSLDVIVYQLHVLKGKYELVIAGPLLADTAASKQIVNDLGKTLAARL